MGLNKEVRGFCFDLDGTLAHTAPDLYHSAVAMCEELSITPPEYNRVVNWIGDGPDALIKRVLADGDTLAASPVIFAAARPIFFNHYYARRNRGTTLYDGADIGLTMLRSLGFPLTCVTNKPTALAVELLEDLNVLQHFAYVLGHDRVDKPKPAPDGLLSAACMLGMSADQLWMIGDSSHDVEAANRAGCGAIAVSYGYNRGQDISASNPDCIIDSIAELPDILDYYRR